MNSSSFRSFSSVDDFMEKLYSSASDDDSFHSAQSVSDDRSSHSAMDVNEFSMGNRSKLSFSDDNEGSPSYSEEEEGHNEKSNSLDPSEESSSSDMADSDEAPMQLSMPSFTISLEDSHFSVEYTDRENASDGRNLDKSFVDFDYRTTGPSHSESADGAASFHLNVFQGEEMEVKTDASVGSTLIRANGETSLTREVVTMAMTAAMADLQQSGQAVVERHITPSTPVETRGRRTKKANSNADSSATNPKPPRKPRPRRITGNQPAKRYEKGQIVHFLAKPVKGHPKYYYTGQIVHQTPDKNGALGYKVRYAYSSSLETGKRRFYKEVDFICPTALIADGERARELVKRTNKRYHTTVNPVNGRKNADRRTGERAKRV